jgi:hypothetical protein
MKTKAMALGLVLALATLPCLAQQKPHKKHPKAKPAATSASNGDGYTCTGKHKCSEMANCEEATFYLNQCGVKKLDRDNDGVPCESLC